MELIDAIATRQSTRKFNAVPVTEADVKAILRAGCAAPVANGGHDRLHFTVVQSRELLRKIGGATGKAFGTPDYDPFYGAGTFVVVSVKPREGEPTIEVADGACAVENMLLMAAGLGLASVYLWSFRWGLKEQPALISELSLPEGFLPVSGAAIGHADEPLAPRELALPGSYNFVK